MSVHFVRHIVRSGDYVRTEFECRAVLGDSCRTVCMTCYGEQRERCECDSEDREPTMGDLGTCGYLPHITEGAPEESYDGPDQPVRGPDWQAIELEWQDEYFVWDYAPAGD